MGNLGLFRFGFKGRRLGSKHRVSVPVEAAASRTETSSKQEELVCKGTSPVKTRENLGRDFAGNTHLARVDGDTES